MLEGKRPLKTVLRYVEDYIEDLLYFLMIEKKTEVEVVVEEEKEESLKLRIITMTPDRGKVESVGMVPKIFPRGFPFIEPIKVKGPLKLIHPIIMFRDEILRKHAFHLLPEYRVFLNNPSKLFIIKLRGYSPHYYPMFHLIFTLGLNIQLNQ